MSSVQSSRPAETVAGVSESERMGGVEDMSGCRTVSQWACGNRANDRHARTRGSNSTDAGMGAKKWAPWIHFFQPASRAGGGAPRK